MSWNNTSADWNMYWNECERCGSRYHASEGSCGCIVTCEKCGEELDENFVCDACDNDSRESESE